MLLAIDIGNTNIVLGLCHGREQTWLSQWRLSTVRDRTADEYAIYIKGLLREAKQHKTINRVIISSVVPQLTRTLADMSRRHLGNDPHIVTAQSNLGVSLGVDFPDQVGADRLVNAVAAYHLYQTACIVIDMGTATKFDVISRTGEFMGGVIAPGLQITADALFQRAAKLGQVEFIAPPNVIGRNTIHAIQSGLIFGYTGQIEGVVPKLKGEMRRRDPLLTGHIPVIGTGGLMGLLAPHTDILDQVDPWLTLTGLHLIAQLNP
jgi:type III pantothenate kinase